jgi:phage terminase large subunit GpA-like protein
MPRAKVPDRPRLYTFRFTAGEARVFRPRETDPATGLPLTVAQWADRFRPVTQGGRTGPWNTTFTEYAREPMEAWTLPWVRRIILCMPPQSSKTQIALNCLAYSADQDPGPALCVLPNENKAKDYLATKLQKMFRTSPRLSELLSPGSFSNRAIKLTNGMVVKVTWATSAAELAQDSYRYTIRDETDKYPDFVGKEADPMGLIDERSNAYPYTSKDITLSTPSLDTGIIWTSLNHETDEVRDRFAVCPICNTPQIMRFENITWPADIRDWRTVLRGKLAHYSCETCGMKWDDGARNEAVRAGYWRPRVPVNRPSVIGFYLPAWYSPFISLSKCAAAYMRSKEDRSKLIYFVTQIKVEGYSERIEAKSESQILSHRTTLPRLVVPVPAILLTAGIDTHRHNFRYVIRAWAADLTSWLIDYGEISAGGTADLERMLFETRFVIEGSNQTMGIWRAAIDTGGSLSHEGETSRTEEIYHWLRKHAIRGVVFGVKGSSHRQVKRVQVSTIDKFPHSSKPIPGGLELRLLDTAQFKNTLHWRLDRKESESQCFYLHKDTGEDYAVEFLAEELHRDRHNREYWRQVRANNHYLDCEVYAAACADPEWFPSLTMLAPALRQRRQAAPAPTPAPKEAPRPAFEKPSWLNR